MAPFRPIRIYWQNGVSRESVCITMWALRNVLSMVNILGQIQIIQAKGLDLTKYVFSEHGNIWSGYLDSLRLLTIMESELQKKTDKFYPVILTSNPLYYSGEQKKYEIYGLAARDKGTIVAAYSKFSNTTMSRYELLRTVVYHEIGHVFGLPNLARKDLVPSPINGTPHCGAICVMLPRVMMVERMVENKKIPFCPRCLSDLRAYFSR